MNKYRIRCPWCPKFYFSSEALTNHLAKVHGNPELCKLQSSSHKCHLSNVAGHPSWNLDEIQNMVSVDCNTDAEPTSEGSDREARYFVSDSDSDSNAGGQQPNTCSTQYQVASGTSIREYLFPEQDPAFNLYALFSNAAHYRLARWFNSARTFQTVIDLFFKGGVFDAHNPTYPVQFRSAYKFNKLIDEAASRPSWHAGAVDYPLLKAVPFRYCNILSVVRYLLHQRVYVGDIVWGPQREYDSEGNHVYSEINTGTSWEDTQVRYSNILRWMWH